MSSCVLANWTTSEIRFVWLPNSPSIGRACGLEEMQGVDATSFSVCGVGGRRIPNIQQGILNDEVYIPAGAGMTQQQIAAEAICAEDASVPLQYQKYFLASPGTRSGLSCLIFANTSFCDTYVLYNLKINHSRADKIGAIWQTHILKPSFWMDRPSGQHLYSQSRAWSPFFISSIVSSGYCSHMQSWSSGPKLSTKKGFLSSLE